MLSRAPELRVFWAVHMSSLFSCLSANQAVYTHAGPPSYIILAATRGAALLLALLLLGSSRSLSSAGHTARLQKAAHDSAGRLPQSMKLASTAMACLRSATNSAVTWLLRQFAAWLALLLVPGLGSAQARLARWWHLWPYRPHLKNYHMHLLYPKP